MVRVVYIETCKETWPVVRHSFIHLFDGNMDLHTSRRDFPNIPQQSYVVLIDEFDNVKSSKEKGIEYFTGKDGAIMREMDRALARPTTVREIIECIIKKYGPDYDSNPEFPEQIRILEDVVTGISFDDWWNEQQFPTETQLVQQPSSPNYR